MQFQFSAGIVVFRMQDGQREYLLLHYPHGHWDLPKGKIEKGESKEQAAVRELKEETSLDAEIINGFEQKFEYFFKHDGELVKKTVYFFVAKALSNDVQLSFEHVGSDWLPYTQARARLTFKNAKVLLQEVEQFLIIVNY